MFWNIVSYVRNKDNSLRRLSIVKQSLPPVPAENYIRVLNQQAGVKDEGGGWFSTVPGQVFYMLEEV